MNASRSRSRLSRLAAAAPLAGLLAGAVLVGSPAFGQATLVGRYEFEDPNNLGLDSSGNGNDLNVESGDVTQAAGQPNAAGTFAAFFDESNGGDVLRRNGGLTGYDGLPGVTFSAWVNNTTNGGFNGVVSQDAGGCCAYRLLLDPNGIPYLNSGRHQDFGLGSAIPSGEWHYLTMTVLDNGAGARTTNFYVDGALVGTDANRAPGLPNASAFNTYVGAGEGGTAHTFNGAIDDLRIFDGALTGDEVAALYQSTIPEPASAGLALAGLGLVGLRRRRR